MKQIVTVLLLLFMSLNLQAQMLFPGFTRDIPEGVKFTPGGDVYDSEEAALLEWNRKAKKKIEPKIFSSKDFTVRYKTKKEGPAFDFNQDLSKLNMEQTRYKKFELFARKGYLFHDAGVRAYFNQFKWYQPIYWIPGLDFSLTPEEETFYQRVKAREKELIKENYLKKTRGNAAGTAPKTREYITANTNNVINFNQFKQIPDSVMVLLKECGFSITQADHKELYELYESNDYETVPSFITTDIYLQLFHAYFVYTLRKIEEQKFIPIITDLSQCLYNESKKMAASKPANPMVADAAEYNQFYYAVPVTIFTGKIVEVPAKYKGIYADALRYIEEANFIDTRQMLFDIDAYDFSIYKPRGNYDRSENLRKYFKAMMWLQTAPFSTGKDTDIARIMFTAWTISTKADKKGVKLLDKFMSVYEPTSFLMGQSDNLSAINVIQAANTLNIGKVPEEIFTAANVGRMRQELVRINPCRIPPGGILDKTPVVNFMPQRYNPDGDMMNRLVYVLDDLERRPFPKGLDVFATMGNKTAEYILTDIYKEQQFWSQYPLELKKSQAFFANYDYTKTFYEQWLGALNSMFVLKSEYPYFMHLDAWEFKNLNTCLASWAELKHDAILYAKQPMIAECGGDYEPENFTPPPPPRAVGYVEPNIEFWRHCLELLKMTKDGMNKYNLFTPDLKAKTARLEEYAQFLYNVSDKELKRIA